MCIHIYTVKYYSAIKYNKILPFSPKWVQLEDTILSEINWTWKGKYCMFSLICGSKTKKTKTKPHSEYRTLIEYKKILNTRNLILNTEHRGWEG